jgi:alcohol dehydrogenase class IV
MKEFGLKTKIFYEENSLDYLKEIKAERVFIISDPFVVTSKMIDQVTSRLNDGYGLFYEIQPDPNIDTVVKGIKELEEFKPDCLIAIGGGSAIDAAKAIMDFYIKIFKVDKMPFIAIPTTSGTGTELTAFSVITNSERGIKYPLVTPDILPDIAILDPNLVVSVPADITADTGMDVLTHAIEAYVSTNANDFSDAFAMKAIKLVFEYLLRAYQDGNDMEAREKMHNASALAGIAFNDVSLGLNHGMAHILGGRTHIPHGRLNSILLPHIIAYNSGINSFEDVYTSTALKYASIASLLNIEGEGIDNDINNVIFAIESLQSNLNIPSNLTDCGIDISIVSNNKEEIASIALADACTLTNPRVPSKEDIVKILEDII